MLNFRHVFHCVGLRSEPSRLVQPIPSLHNISRILSMASSLKDKLVPSAFLNLTLRFILLHMLCWTWHAVFGNSILIQAPISAYILGLKFSKNEMQTHDHRFPLKVYAAALWTLCLQSALD